MRVYILAFYRVRTLLASNSMRNAFRLSCFAAVTFAMYGCGSSTDLSLGAERVDPAEPEIAARMTELIREISAARGRTAFGTFRRFNQGKSLGCFEAEFRVNDGLPERLAHGLFAEPATYPATLRFANASEDDDTRKDLRGLSIKVRGITGTDAAGRPVQEQDFLLNSYPALFAATPMDFLSFIEATHRDRVWWYFVNPLDSHLGSLRILMKARDNPTSPFDIQYWSTTPYRLGPDTATAVKYATRSCSTIRTEELADDDENYLSRAMAGHLARGPACFDLMVQFQTDAEEMPIEDASVIWSEEDSPFLPVARITIAPQEFRDDRSMEACERLTFNPWSALAEHRPIGGMNRVREAVYRDV